MWFIWLLGFGVCWQMMLLIPSWVPLCCSHLSFHSNGIYWGIAKSVVMSEVWHMHQWMTHKTLPGLCNSSFHQCNPFSLTVDLCSLWLMLKYSVEWSGPSTGPIQTTGLVLFSYQKFFLSDDNNDFASTNLCFCIVFDGFEDYVDWFELIWYKCVEYALCRIWTPGFNWASTVANGDSIKVGLAWFSLFLDLSEILQRWYLTFNVSKNRCFSVSMQNKPYCWIGFGSDFRSGLP